MMEQWVGKIEDPEKEFNAIDENGGGMILFDEFCDWAIWRGLDLEDDEDAEKDTESDVSHVELSLIEHCDVLDERKSIKVCKLGTIVL